MAIGLTQSPATAVGVLAWILGIHQLEANFLNPKIIGDAAKIHPVLVVFSLIVGEHFFQLAGALFAVPCMSIAQTLFLHFRESTMGRLRGPARRPSRRSRSPGRLPQRRRPGCRPRTTWYGRRVALKHPCLQALAEEAQPQAGDARTWPRAPSAAPLPPDPLSRQALRPIALRVGIPLALLWIGAIVLNGRIPKAVMGVLTLALAGVLFWAYRYATAPAQRAPRSSATSAAPPRPARRRSPSSRPTSRRTTPPPSSPAPSSSSRRTRAQALRTLETIKLDKVLGPVADETRAQRAMIHLILGETDEARQLVDVIDMSQQKEAKPRATIAAIVGEAWARSGQAKRAVELLETIDPDDEIYAELRPQLLRARAFAYAWASDTKQMKQVLRRLAQINPQYLMGFITRKKNPAGVNPRGIHPLLEKEAYEMVMRSGAAPRRMEFKRG